ncbi:MAG: hypothetical protein EHM45_13790 [Desulfobacteraceae bacterium]|nr:MAG: hypothetical protein EHM45_13790 [Desulfobacteraceae bacterium]
MVYGAQQHFSKNYEMLAQCRNSGIKTLFVFDSWKNYLVNFRDPLSGVFYLPSRIAVADQAMKAGILSALAGYTEENIESKIDILGQPAIDASISYISSLSPENVASLRKRYNPDRKILRLFIMEPIREDFLQVNQVDPGYDEYTILEYFLTHLCTENSRVLIKVHPRQKRDEFLKSIPFVLRNARKLFMEIEYDEKIEHLIAIADEIYGMTSISLTVAIRCGKKAGSVQVGRNGYGNTLSNPELEKCLIV